MMGPVIKYQNHLGKSVDLSSNGIVADPTDVLAWSLEVNDSYGTVMSIGRSVESRKMRVVTYSMAARKRLYEVPAADVDAMRPGRLYVGDWYLVCYVTSSSVRGWWYGDGVSSYEVEVTVVDAQWRKDVQYVLTERYDGGAGLDFPYDFPYDFGYSTSAFTVNNVGFKPADAVIRVYGPVDSCQVTVSGNEYSVGVSLEVGEYVTIDTYERTVKVTRLTGDVEDAFPHVEGDYFEGSGSYIFERIPVGLSDVIWSGTSDLDLTVVLMRDEPDYTDLMGAA